MPYTSSLQCTKKFVKTFKGPPNRPYNWDLNGGYTWARVFFGVHSYLDAQSKVEETENDQ